MNGQKIIGDQIKVGQNSKRIVRSSSKTLPEPRIRNSMVMYLWGISVAMGSLISGYLFVIISVLSRSMVEYASKSSGAHANMSFYISICTTALSIGGLVGTLLYSKTLSRLGGQNRLMAACDISMITLTLLQLSSLNIYQHTLTRLLQGFIVGIYGIAVPTYLMSISPTKMSGQMGSLNQIMITVGIAIGYCMGYLIDQNNLTNQYKWRICILVPFPMCMLRLFIGQVFPFDRLQSHIQRKDWKNLFNYLQKFYQPDSFSLQSLIKSKNISVQNFGKIPKNKQSLYRIKSIRFDSDQSDLSRSRDSLASSQSDNKTGTSISKKLRNRVSFALCFVSQFCGINAIIFYANQLFLDISHGDSNYAVRKSVQLGFFQIFVTLISGAFLDNFGRRTLLLGGSFMIITALMSGYYMLDFDKQSKWDPQYVTYTIFLHIAGFSLSFGPITVVYVSEILQQISFNMTLIWIETILISLTSNIMIEQIGTGRLFFIYGVFTIAGVVYIKKYMLETKGKTRQQIVKSYDKFCQQIHYQAEQAQEEQFGIKRIKKIKQYQMIQSSEKL